MHRRAAPHNPTIAAQHALVYGLFLAFLPSEGFNSQALAFVFDLVPRLIPAAMLIGGALGVLIGPRSHRLVAVTLLTSAFICWSFALFITAAADEGPWTGPLWSTCIARMLFASVRRYGTG